jgi:hypothetical protein
MYETRIILREAIRRQRPIVGVVAGLKREFCPHVFGQTDSEWRALVWQFGGLCEYGLPEGGEWRCFAVEDMRDLKIRNGEWRRGWVWSLDEIADHVALVDTAVDPAFGPEIRGGLLRRLRLPGFGLRAKPPL